MIEVILTPTLSLITTFVAMPVIIRIARLKNLYDIPNARKIHVNPVASLGGVGMFAGFIIPLLLSGFSGSPEFPAIVAAALVLFFLGIKDDILVISPLKKFIGQVIAALILILKGGILVADLHGFLGIYAIPYPLAVALNALFMVLVINCFNLIDGVDGLAASLGLLASLVFGIYFLGSGYPAYSVMAFCLTGCLTAFLYFNFQPARIFMGDTGSMLIGLVGSILLIRFINVAPVDDHSPLYSAPAIALSAVSIPLLDALRVFTIRILKGRSPFDADRRHVHHLLLHKGLSHKLVSLVLVVLNALFILLCLIADRIGNLALIGIMAGVFYSLVGSLQYREYRLTRTRKKEIHSRRPEAARKVIIAAPNSLLEG